MIRVQVNKNELEDFIDSLENDFSNLKGKISLGEDGEIDNISFKDFKTYFCNDNISFSKLVDDDFKLLKIIYGKISSDDSIFYLNIRNFIIENFTKEIRFCPYCGKVPLIHYGKDLEKERLFQFDHFFPKNYYHKGIINFYNLIPSCSACNHLKGEDNPLDVIINGGIIFHPYFGNIYLDKRNELQRDCKINAYEKLDYTSDNSKFFKLAQKYLHSQDTYNTFNFILEKREKMKDLEKSFKNKNGFSTISKEKLKNYFFESYYPKNEEDILKYGNGKLKKDLIDNLELK